MQESQQVVNSAFDYLVCLDSDDVEDYLVEEGIGHRDRSGNFQHGPAVEFEDIADEHFFEKEGTEE
jgi:hypothetical protein